MENNKQKRELKFETIFEAIKGDEEAEEAIYDYYEPYIIKLSKVPYINDAGEVKYTIDEDIYMSLKLKLHELVSNFQIA